MQGLKADVVAEGAPDLPVAVTLPTEESAPPSGPLRRGALLVLISAASFGAMPIFAKLAYAEGINAKTLLALRFTLAASALWLVWIVNTRHSGRAINLRRLPPLVAMGALGYVGQSFSYFTAVSLISASATGLLLYTYPTLVTLLAWVFFREKLTGQKLGALAVSILGTLMVLGIVSEALGLSNGNALAALDPSGVFWGLAAAVIYSAYIIAGTRFTAGVDSIFSSAVIISSAAVVYVAWGGLEGTLSTDFRPCALLWALAIALISTILAITTFFAGLKLVGPSRASIMSTIEPAVTVGLAFLVLQERISAEQVAGGVLILLAVVALQLGRKQKQHLP